MFIEYIPRQTFIHKLDVRTKILGFTGLILLAFLFENPLYNLFLAASLAMAAGYAGLPFRKTGSLLVPLIPIYILIMLLSGFTPADKFILPLDRTIILNLWPQNNIMLTVGGLFKGCTLLIRLLIMVLGSSLLTLTTPLDDFIQLFSLMKIPYEFSFLITTALRFIPTMNRKRLMIIDAQKSRGADLQQKGIIAPVKSMIPVMVPMMTGSIIMANNLSRAMLNRGFGAPVERRPLKNIALQNRDYQAFFIIAFLVILGIYIRFGLNLGRL